MNSKSQHLVDRLPLIPKPQSLVLNEGSFTIEQRTVITVIDKDAMTDARVFNDYLEEYYGFRLNVVQGKRTGKNGIYLGRLKISSTVHAEEYILRITPNGIDIEGGPGAGILYGLQTLIQLMPAGKVPSLSIPCVEIKDKPRFSWRGMHLDVSRHFFPVHFIKRYIDYLASYKMNTFHWHLTDDQGWRIEIKKYPKLSEVSAFRNSTLIGHLGTEPQVYDSIRYGGFYTQEEIREVVEYAAKRHITIVPEIEMPGHALAALAAYPEYSCTGGPFEVGQKWGIFYDVFCTKESTFNFLEDVLEEVSLLFPGKYIHVGGDECPKDRWKACLDCQNRMKSEGLKDEHELQSYFINRIGKKLSSLNKKLIGWDEILDGGLAPDATVMSWRGKRGGVAAAKLGHDVVMTPTSHCYFDFYQSLYPEEPLAIGGYLPVEKVYAFEPVPEDLSVEESKYILGAQANVWTEYIRNSQQVEYMIFPRMSALAEVLWSSKETRDYDDFTKRITGHFKLLDFKKVNYSNATFDVYETVLPHENKRGLSIALSSNVKEGTVYYTINGMDPDLNAQIYSRPVLVDQSIGIRAKVYDGIIPRGREYSRVFHVNLATAKDITLKSPPHEEYSRGGGFTLVNGVIGNIPWMPSEWLGFLGDDLDALIDLGSVMNVSSVGLDALRDENSWIYFPVEAEVLLSEDGEKFTSVAKRDKNMIDPTQRMIMLKFERTKARWVRVIVKNFGTIPEGRPGAGKPSWLLVDEIQVE